MTAFALTTCDPAFQTDAPVSVNGFLFVPAACNDAHEVAYIQFSDCGQHIRRWSRTPFDGGRTCRIALQGDPA